MNTATLSVSSPQLSAPTLVGREQDLSRLHDSLAKALRGTRQVVFMSGEPGIGKTTLLEAFLARLSERRDLHIAFGQCIEHYGTGEAYLPLLEATTRLCRASGGQRRIEGLKRYAPTWLAQLPALLDPHELTVLQQRIQGTSRDRMLREMTEATEVFATRHGLVLVLEDLHWSDTATLEWLAYIARRREPVKLLILGTYRPTEMLSAHAPLKSVVHELLTGGQCEELAVTPLAETAVIEYLTQRLAGGTIGPEPLSAVAALLHRRTGGNPLFLVNTLDDLMRHGALTETAGRWTIPGNIVMDIAESVPDTLRQMIARQVERLDEQDQHLLEAASVAGVEFATAVVAASLQSDTAALEERCEQLARKGQFLRNAGIEEWPDGTISGRYSFRHALYQNVLYERIAEVRRIRFHRAVGARKEQGYGVRAGEIATELATQFAAGRDGARALEYTKRAAETAVSRHAHQEAVRHFTTGLALLETLPVTTERLQHELGLQVRLAASLMAFKGYAAPEVEQAYARARVLCRQVEATPQVFPVLRGLMSFYHVRARLQTARELGEQLLALCQRVDDTLLHVQTHYGQGSTLFDLGEFDQATAHLEQALTLYNPEQHAAHVSLYGGYDPGVACLQWRARILWVQGYPTQAKQRSDEALRLAQELGHPLSLAWAWCIAAVSHQYRGEEDRARACVTAALSLVQEHELAFVAALATILHGWGLVGQQQNAAGIEKIREGLAAYRATGAVLSLPGYFSLLAGAQARSGKMAEAHRLLTEAFAATNETDERWFEAELYRINGELTFHLGARGRGLGAGDEGGQKIKLVPNTHHPTPSIQEAEGYFLKAIDIAHRQGAKSWELRATMSLARLWQRQHKGDEARALLEEVHGWFTEGFETKDLQDAEALLLDLGSTVKRTEGERRKNGGADEKEPGRREDDTVVPPSSSPIVAPPSSPPQPLIPSPQPPTPNLFLREGEYWTVGFAGGTCRLKDSVSLRYLALLLQHPHEEFHVLRIVSDGAAEDGERLGSSSRRTFSERRGPEQEALSGFGDAGELLDPQARAAYKQRVADLQVELGDALERQDQEGAHLLQEEMAFLTKELSQAVGLGGRMRKAAEPAERARVAVTKAIKGAIRKISEQHPALGHHLAQTIRTGVYCSYVPHPSLPIMWQTSAP